MKKSIFKSNKHNLIMIAETIKIGKRNLNKKIIFSNLNF